MSDSTGSAEPVDTTGRTHLRAGGLTARFVNGDLVDVRWHGSEIVQRVYMAVRDRAWNTIPATLYGARLVQSDDVFTLDFDAVNEYGGIDFEWHGRIHGDADGSLSYAWSGDARGAFDYCKIGLNLHHSLDAYVGRPFSIRTPRGQFDGVFDADIAPQLVKDGSLTAMTPYFDELAVRVRGADVTFSFEGDLFELQDHRNWADANWKTYGTPLEFGFPMTIETGQRLQQVARVSMVGIGIGRSDEAEVATCRLERSSNSVLPRIGHLWTDAPSQSEMALLRAAAPDHIRIDLHAAHDFRDRLERARETCAALGCHLEVAAFLRPDLVAEDAAVVARALADGTTHVDRILVLQESGGFSEFGGAAPPHMGELLVHATTSLGIDFDSVVSGTPQSFNDLNRDRPDYSGIDGLVFALNPQVHASDDDSLMQNAKAIPHIVDFARRLFGEVDVVLSPVDLVGVNGPFPAGPGKADGASADEDPRQWTGFGAAWTLSALSEMARCRTTSATMFELTGARGLVSGHSTSPAFGLLAALASVREWSLHDAYSSAPDQLSVLAFGRAGRVRAFVGNLTSEPLRFSWIDNRVTGEAALVRATSVTRVDDVGGSRRGTDDRVIVLDAYEVVSCEFAVAEDGGPVR